MYWVAKVLGKKYVYYVYYMSNMSYVYYEHFLKMVTPYLSI